ncbi:hypothetical protein Peur_051904 [Populus x canadensis]
MSQYYMLARRAWFYRNKYKIDRCRQRKVEDNSRDRIEDGCPSIIINQPSEDPKQEAPYNYNFLRQLELMLTFQKVMIAEAAATNDEDKYADNRLKYILLLLSKK